MKSAILATLIASATAFAPSATTRSSTQLNEFANGLVGGESVEPMPFRPDGPKNAANFDPAGFTEVRIVNSIDTMVSVSWMERIYVMSVVCISLDNYLPSLTNTSFRNLLH